jgi:hypothetical protein
MRQKAKAVETIPESIVLTCIADCLEKSRYYVREGNRPLADWWHDRADVYADRLATYREIRTRAMQPRTTSS